ncbi:hypothetical protein L0128_19840, partial [candidate division KSB1 bacterium]|nr:hypothetical protein [candidate division KSB1 bacterium]
MSDTTDSATLILASPADAYYRLAQEIAAAENLTICHTLDEIIVRPPTFLLWVISPESLSERKLIDFNKKTGTEFVISTGIITGNTIDAARKLWLAAKKKPGHFYVVIISRPIPATNTKMEVTQYQNNRTTVLPLTRKNILDNLAQADYFVYNGHAGPGTWVENIHAPDIPGLKSGVIFSFGCNNLNVSRPNTIALTCIDQGAKAFGGYLFSPHASTIIGKTGGLTCQHTWPEFPIGHIAQIHNHELTKWMAAVPYFFLIGDPRLSFQNAPPYRLVEDRRVTPHQRVLKFTDAAIGLIPVRIPQGADYHFVSITNCTASSDHDTFFNSRLQMTNIQHDKYMLFENIAKEFTITLFSAAPIPWLVQDYVLDSFDKYVESLQHPSLYPLLVIFLIIHVVILFTQKKINPKYLGYALVVGIIWSLLIGVYTCIRWSNLTVTSKLLVFSCTSVISYSGNFIFTTYGAFLCFTFHSAISKIIGLLTA